MTQKGAVQQGRRRDAEFEVETSLSPGSAFWGRCRAGYLHGSLCQVGRTPHGDWRFRVREPPAPASSPVWPDLLSPARGQLENRATDARMSGVSPAHEARRVIISRRQHRFGTAPLKVTTK